MGRIGWEENEGNYEKEKDEEERTRNYNTESLCMHLYI